MALTYQQVRDLIDSNLADNITQQISEADIRAVCHAINDRTNESNIQDLNIEWNGTTTYALAEIVTYQDRIWKSKQADNLNHEPPTDPGVTEDDWWIEQSQADSSPIQEWEAGIYGSGLIIVYYSGDFYQLVESTRPYESTNIETEFAAGDWKIIPGSFISVAAVDVSDVQEGESKILLVKKEVGTGDPVFEGAVAQLDKLVAPTSFDTLLADTAAWIGDEITLTGDNRLGALGENGQEHQANGQFYLCISHNYGTDATDGSATWVRNRSNDAIQPDTITQDSNVADELDPSRTGGDVDDGWNTTTNTKVITVRSKVGSWWANPSGYVYLCYAESGSNWYWKRVAQPTAEFRRISDSTLIAEIEAHDFGATPILEPVATEKGLDDQEHYWEVGVDQTGEVLGSGDDTTKQFTGNLGNTPVTPGSISITDGTQVVTDDGNGNLIGDVDGAGNNTIDYSTGAYDVTFTAAPPSGVDNITSDYESGPYTPHLAKCIDDSGTIKWIKVV